jgi:signal transduction histidine kinase
VLRIKGKTSRYAIPIHRKNGETRIIQVSASPLCGEGGKYSGSIAIITDITEREQMQQKLQEYSQQLEMLVGKRTRKLREAQEQLLKSQRLSAIGELAGMVGHDLRNPLMGMAGAVYYLKTKSESKLDNTESKMLKIIEENITYANKIVSDLQEYSKEMHLELEETNVKALLKESLASVNIPDNIEVIDKTPKSHKIEVDVAKIRRVFSNIIKNAIEAMPKGGKLAIKSSKTQTCMEITFTDTGKGIPADIVAKIGKPLVTTKAKGMGFGLAICNRIMEAHKGKLSIKSEAEKGTTVKLTFPLTKKKEKVKFLTVEAKSVTPKR